ncbi:MAG: hypothetical protein ABI548_00080 [Polyangiaceae bacterium]
MNQRFGVMQALRFAVFGAALCGVSACNGCGSEKPYTPFGVASSLPSANVAPSAAPAPTIAVAAPMGFPRRRAELVPGAPAAWQGSGLDLQAPPSRRFAQVLPADFDDDQKPDAIAWLVPDPHDKTAPPGELWYFGNGATPKKLAGLPGFVPTGPDCTLSPTLTQTSVHSATLDVSSTCKMPLISRAPARALLVVSPRVERPVLITLRAADAAPGETLDFRVDSSDQDGDGRDDVRVTVSVGTGGGGEPASADLEWLDRAAGSSRSASEPVASLMKLGNKLSVRARIKHSGYKPESAANAQRLLSSLCAEGGVARLFDEDGAPFRCGELTHVIDSLAAANLGYALAQGDVLEAFATLRRDGWDFRALSPTQRKTMERELLHAVSRLDLAAPFVAHAAPTVPQLPHYSPLWFEADGALLIRGNSGVTRVAANRSGEQAVSEDGGVPSWPLELTAPSGQRITGTSHACDRSELLFNQSDAQHALLPPLTSRLLAARPASCTGRGTGPAVSIAPFAFDESGLDALVAGSRVSSAPGPSRAASLPRMGTPHSPDGRWLVTPTALGLLVVGDHKELWQTSALNEHGDASKFSDCVVANDARAVSCIEAGHVLVFERGTAASSRAAHK